MVIEIFDKSQQAKGSFNNGEILENKPIGFPQDGGFLKPYSNYQFHLMKRQLITITKKNHLKYPNL